MHCTLKLNMKCVGVVRVIARHSWSGLKLAYLMKGSSRWKKLSKKEMRRKKLKQIEKLQKEEQSFFLCFHPWGKYLPQGGKIKMFYFKTLYLNTCQSHFMFMFMFLNEFSTNNCLTVTLAPLGSISLFPIF